MFLRLFFCMGLLTLLSACDNNGSDKSNHTTHAQSTHQNQSAIVQAGPLQLSFDITTMNQHLDMMKTMNMEVDHKKGASHYVTLTLLDKAKQVVKNVPTKIKIVGPDKQVLTDKSGSTMDIMSKGSMFHYGYGFNPKTKGNYNIIVMLKYKEKVYTSGTPWSHS